MSKNQDNFSVYTMSRCDFDQEDKKNARDVFSRCSNAVFNYLLISSVILLIVFLALIFVSEDISAKILSLPYLDSVLQVSIMYLIAFPIFWLSIRKLPKAVREKNKLGLFEFIALFSISLIFSAIGSMISDVTSDYLGSVLATPTTTEITTAMLQVAGVIPAIVVVVIIGPIFEELIFRKLLIDRLSIYGDRLAVVVTSIGFGFFHCNISQIFFTTLVGFLWGHAYTKTRRIIYPILLHILFNLFSTIPTILAFLSASGYSFVTTLDSIVDVTTSIIIYYGLIMIFVTPFIKKYRLSKECDIAIPKLKLFGIVVLNKGTLLFLAYTLFLTLYPFITHLIG